MASIQAWLLYRLTKRSLAKLRAKKLDIQAFRAERDKAAGVFRFPKSVSSIAAEGLPFPAEWQIPATTATPGAVLYLHGGAYDSGSLVTHRALAAAIAAASGAKVLLIEYALAPERSYPHAFNDAKAAYDYLSEQTGGPAAICGDSAGGGLGLALALSLRDAGDPLPACLALMSPWTDLTLSGKSHKANAAVDPFFPNSGRLTKAAAAYVGEEDTRNPLISPLFADLSGLPPVLVHVGEKEAVLDDSLLFIDKAKAAGVDARVVVWPGMWHVWQMFQGRLPEATKSVAELGAFLRKQLIV